MDDTLYVVLYMDQGVDGYSPIFGREVIRDRRGQAQALVTLGPFQANSPNVPIFSVGLHVVDAVVSDVELDNQNPPRLPDGGLGDPVVYSWFVQTIPGGCP